MSHSQEKNGLTAEEIASIIKTCGEARVAKLQFRDLKVEFNPSVEQFLESAGLKPRSPAPSPLAEAEISEIQNKEAKRAFIQDEVSVREDQIMELLLTDPVSAEKLLVQGELEEPVNGTTGEEL